jgi:hypothetical protein
LLASAEISPGELVALPANASRPLVEAIKQAKAQPYFVNLDADLTLHVASPAVQLAWGHSLAGVTLPVNFGGPVWLDCADTLPGPVTPSAEVSLYGLHLTVDERSAGALLVFRKAELAERGLSERTIVVERASHAAGRVTKNIHTLRGKPIHYLSLLIVFTKKNRRPFDGRLSIGARRELSIRQNRTVDFYHGLLKNLCCVNIVFHNQITLVKVRRPLGSAAHNGRSPVKVRHCPATVS